MSSCGIFVIDNRIWSHFESNSWIASFRRPIVNRSALFSTESWAPVTEVLVDQVSCLCLPRRKRSSLWAFISSRLTFFLKRVFWMILFSAEAILASSTSKFGIWIPLTDDEDLRSSTDSTISTSLIHSIASIGNCEQVHTSVLNLIFQQANVVSVGNLSKWRSEICSPCWSAP